LPGDLVDEGKLLVFIHGVAKRSPKTGARSAQAKKRTTATTTNKKRKNGPGPDSTIVGGVSSDSDSDDQELSESKLKLKYNTVRNYISAIQKLYDEQSSMGINPAPRSQGVALKVLKQSILRSTWSRNRKDYSDRGEGTIKDSYLPSQVFDHTAEVWKVNTRKEVAFAFRTQVDFLFGNHMLLRGSNRRPLELPDCFCLDLPNEGPKISSFPTKALVVVMRQGKTNQHGRMEYGSALRHRDPHACLIGALAFWFFWRWQIEKQDERFPSFVKSEDWYDIKILRRSAKEVKGEISPQTANDWTRRYYNRCGIKTSKASHAPRVAGSQNADLSGVAEGQVCKICLHACVRIKLTIYI
jgi:hypothetical protein